MKNPRTAWIVYASLRLLFFAAPFALLFVLGLKPWVAAIFAALIGMSLSIIFLSRSRATASESIYDWRNRDRTADDIAEDDVIAESDEAAEAAAHAADAAAETPAAEGAGSGSDAVSTAIPAGTENSERA